MKRHLPKALKEYFNALLANDIGVHSPDEMLRRVASGCIGVTEIGGDNKGPLVELFQATVGRPEGQSWCLDFLQACIAYVEEIKEIESALPATELCMGLWTYAPSENKSDTPKLSDLVVWQYGDTMHGHVGLISDISANGDFITTIEGNTTGSKGLDTNGDGVFQKTRRRFGMGQFRELGFLRVFA